MAENEIEDAEQFQGLDLPKTDLWPSLNDAGAARLSIAPASNEETDELLVTTTEPKQMIEKESQSNPESVPPLLTGDVSFPNEHVLSWSKTLQSPTLATFSPAIDPTKPPETNRHGTGLQIALTRGKQVQKTTQRCVAILQEMASLYSNYATALSKAGQALPTPTDALTCAYQTTKQTEPIPIQPLQDSMAAWAQEKTNVASQIREAISPLSNLLGTHSDLKSNVKQRYKESRDVCFHARGRALSSHTKYLKAVKDVEQILQELKAKDGAPHVNENNGTNKKDNSSENSVYSTDPPTPKTPNKPPKRLETKLKETFKELNNYGAKYRIRVKWENQCVEQCQRLESMALESMQQMEQDRLSIFVNTVLKVVAAQKASLDSGVISLTAGIDIERSQEPAGQEETNRASKLYKMFTGSGSFLNEDETSGVMDADTLGLPDEVGRLRERVRSLLAARRERINLSKSLSQFFDIVVKGSFKLGQSLNQLLKKENINGFDSLNVAMGACEGAHMRRLWDGVTKFIESESEGCFALADSLRNLKVAKLESVILHGEKAMQTTSESDDAAWKQLCEAARAQVKAESRHRQSHQETVKARERVLSLELAAEEKEVKPKTVVGKRVQKGLANIVSQGMSLLPDSGDIGMKLLNHSSRISVAQRALKEADEKQAKETQLLVSLRETTIVVKETYKKDAESVVARYDQEEKQGWNDVRSTIEAFAKLAHKLVGTLQLEAISDLQPIVANSQIGIVADLNDWRMKAQQELVAVCVDCTVAEDLSQLGFRLDASPKASRLIDEYRQSADALAETDGRESISDDVSVEDDMDEDDSDQNKSENAEGTASVPPEQSEPADDGNVRVLFKRPVLPASPQIVISANRSNAKKYNKISKTFISDHEDSNTALFLTYFWPDPVDSKNVPVVVCSFPCSFRDLAQQLPIQYGRVFLSATRIIFASWAKKKLSVKWEEVRAIKPCKGFEGLADTSLQVVCKRNDSQDESSMILDGFFDRQNAASAIEKVREDARVAAETRASLAPLPSSVAPGGVVPPDATIKQMSIVVSKYLRKTNVEKFHRIFWLEEKSPFRIWLEKDAFDIEFGDRKPCRSPGPWCKETYTEERTIKFRVKRKTHLYIGPPIANVTQVYRGRLEGNDKCVVSTTSEIEGVPYSDTFAVEVRWVALREGTDDIKVECGLFVNFKKNTMFKKQIQTGTIEESTPAYVDLFKMIQAVCVAPGGMEIVEEVETVEVEQTRKEGMSISELLRTLQENPNLLHIVSIVGPLLLFVFYRLFLAHPTTARVAANSEMVIQRLDVLEAKIEALQSSIQELLRALKEK